MERLNFRLIVALAAIVRLAWAVILPPFQGPDEMFHAQTVAFFATHGLPSLAQIETGQWPYYIATPPLPYLPYLVLYRAWTAVALSTPPLWWLRLGSVLAGVGVVIIVIQVSKRLFTDQRRFTVPLFVALLPQLCFASAYVNWDIVSVLIASALVPFWLTFNERAPTSRQCIAVGVTAGLLVLCKPTAFGALPVTLVTFLFALSRHKQAWPRSFWLAAGPCAIVAGPFLIHNALKLSGDPFGVSTIMKHSGPQWSAAQPGSWLQLFDTRWAFNSFESFWGLYGHMAIKLPNVFYVSFAAASFIAIAGLFRLRQDERTTEQKRLSTWFALSIALTFMLAYLMSATQDFQPQGRYFFPAIIPLSVFFVSGFARMLDMRLLFVLLLAAQGVSLYIIR